MVRTRFGYTFKCCMLLSVVNTILGLTVSRYDAGPLLRAGYSGVSSADSSATFSAIRMSGNSVQESTVFLDKGTLNVPSGKCRPDFFPTLQFPGFCATEDQLDALCGDREISPSSRDCRHIDGQFCCYFSPFRQGNFLLSPDDPDLMLPTTTTDFPPLKFPVGPVASHVDTQIGAQDTGSANFPEAAPAIAPPASLPPVRPDPAPPITPAPSPAPMPIPAADRPLILAPPPAQTFQAPPQPVQILSVPQQVEPISQALIPAAPVSQSFPQFDRPQFAAQSQAPSIPQAIAAPPTVVNQPVFQAPPQNFPQFGRPELVKQSQPPPMPQTTAAPPPAVNAPIFQAPISAAPISQSFPQFDFPELVVHKQPPPTPQATAAPPPVVNAPVFQAPPPPPPPVQPTQPPSPQPIREPAPVPQVGDNPNPQCGNVNDCPDAGMTCFRGQCSCWLQQGFSAGMTWSCSDDNKCRLLFPGHVCRPSRLCQNLSGSTGYCQPEGAIRR